MRTKGKQYNFNLVDPALIDRLDESDNKTADITAALRLFYGMPSEQLTPNVVREIVQEELARVRQTYIVTEDNGRRRALVATEQEANRYPYPEAVHRLTAAEADEINS